MTDLQEAEIRDYLLSKKLPIDILLEVQDHFINQIKNLEFEKNFTFEDAFKTVKENWRKDLTLSWKGGFSLEDSTDLMRKMRKEIDTGNLLLTFKYLVPYVLTVFLLANILNQFLFQIIFFATALIPFFYAAINYFYHYRDFRLPKKYQSHILTLHQNGIFMFFLVISPILNIVGRIVDKPQQFQQIFLFRSSGIVYWQIFAVFLTVILFFGGTIYSIISQKKYLGQIKIIKPFLKYLKAS